MGSGELVEYGKREEEEGEERWGRREKKAKKGDERREGEGR